MLKKIQAFSFRCKEKTFRQSSKELLPDEIIIFISTNTCMDTQTITSIAMGIALSACCGFRVFIPLLGASFAAYQNWFTLPIDMSWMGSLPAIICFGSAAMLEIAAYYIPFVDNLLDTIATPLAAVAGTVLAASFLPIAEINPMLKWLLAIIAGGGAAATVQTGTGLLRLVSSKTTAGVGNSFVATGENALAISGTLLSFIVPVVMGILFLLLIFWIGRKFLRTARSA
jgi:Domain of unknown function (DUF4126)